MGAKITNKYNLPDTIAKACAIDTHTVAGNISVTQLIDSCQIRILKRKNDYEEDVSEKLYALLGTALHHILERANIDNVRKRAFILTADTIIKKAESLQDEAKANQLKAAGAYIQSLIPVFFPELNDKYIFEKTMSLDVGNNTTLYGTFDLFDKHTGILYDYKCCSVYAWIFPESRRKWMQQLNVYASMIEKTLGVKVNGIRIVAFFRDWSESGKMRNADYPDAQVMEIPIELRTMPEIDEYIAKRIHSHLQAEAGDIILCNGNDRWAKADQWAVMIQGQKKAHRLFDMEEPAQAYILENQHKFAKPFVLEYRAGDSVRCEKFCPVSKFCNQRKQELEEKQLREQKYGKK